MKEKIKLKRYMKIKIGAWAVFFVIASIMTNYFIQYQPILRPYLKVWYPLLLLPVIYGIEIYLYKKNREIVMNNNHIKFPPRYNRTKNRTRSQIKYDELKKVVIHKEELKKIVMSKEDKKEYLQMIIDEEYGEYKISSFTGKENASRMLRILKRVLREKNCQVEMEVVRS